MPRFVFIEVSAGSLDDLSVSVNAQVIDAEDEKEAWEKMGVEEEPEPQEKQDSQSEEENDDYEEEEEEKRVRGIQWNRDHDHVTIIQLIPDKPGWHSLGWACNG